jgi:hypothetical protein
MHMELERGEKEISYGILQHGARKLSEYSK